MKDESKFARRVFLGAGIYGILVMAPQYLLETGIGPALPEPLTRPEHFYGFIGLALVWQLAFLMIARDVRRFRPLMPIAVLEKLAFGLPALLLYARGRVGAAVLAFGSIDLALGVLFILAHRATPRESSPIGSSR
jgi:hypothetical protein